MKKIIVATSIFVLVFMFSTAAFSEDNKTLVVYYSRTGTTKIIAETVARSLSADCIQIIEVDKDRSGVWGFIKAGFDAFLDRHSIIDPYRMDVSGYSSIIIASPIWSWNLATPMHTLLLRNDFTGKNLILITTANISIKKYARYGDDASWLKRYLRDYLNDKRKKARRELDDTGGEFTFHYHFETKGRTRDELRVEAEKAVEDIKKGLFSNT